MQANKSTHWKLINIYKFPLFLAVLIHLIFIAMLARHTPTWQKPKVDKPSKPILSELSVSLQPAPIEIEKPVEKEPGPKPELEPKPEPELMPEPDLKPPVVKAAIEPPALRENEIEREVITNTSIEEESPTAMAISSNRLHSQLIQQLQNNRNLAKNAKLGTFNSRVLPGNWTRQAVSYTPGMFRAAQLPGKAVVLDQWKSPDGGMQNRVKLPNGDVVCGNLTAHNPLDIYSMPIWMYRPC